MKKTFLALCLLYSANACAMNAGKQLVWLITAPALVPGAYFGYKTVADRQAVRQKMQGQPEKEIEIEVTCVPNYAIEYSDGVLGGIAPVINILKLCNARTSSPSHCIDEMGAVEKAGFLNGLSVFAMYPVLLRLIQKMK